MERQEFESLTEIMKTADWKEAARLLTQEGFIRWASGFPLRPRDFQKRERTQTPVRP